MDQKKELAMFPSKMLCVTIAVAAISCVAAPQRVAAASPDNSANITYTAKGTFASPALSGSDQLILAGQKFEINIVANSSLKPSQHGRNWAQFDSLKWSGTIYSGLLPNKPQQPCKAPAPPGCSKAVIAQIVGASEDIFQAGFPVEVIGIRLTVIANFTLPGGTLVNDLIRPFSSVALDITNATVTYKDASASTVLAVQSGTVVATLPTGGGAAEAAVTAPSSVVLLAGAQALKPQGLSAIWQ
jgi:hypothetical protein